MTTQIIPSPIEKIGLKPSQFLFSIPRFDDIYFPVQSVAIPSSSLGVARQSNPRQDVKWPGEKIEYSDLQFKFILDEDLSVYTKLYGWMRALGIPTMINDLAYQVQGQANDQDRKDLSNKTSDCSLIVLTGKNNPTVQFTFKYAFPTSLGQVQFDTTADGQEYLFCDCAFAFTYMTIDKIT